MALYCCVISRKSSAGKSIAGTALPRFSIFPRGAAPQLKAKPVAKLAANTRRSAVRAIWVPGAREIARTPEAMPQLHLVPQGNHPPNRQDLQMQRRLVDTLDEQGAIRNERGKTGKNINHNRIACRWW